jgi:hypothetical protein
LGIRNKICIQAKYYNKIPHSPSKFQLKQLQQTQAAEVPAIGIAAYVLSLDYEHLNTKHQFNILTRNIIKLLWCYIFKIQTSQYFTFIQILQVVTNIIKFKNFCPFVIGKQVAVSSQSDKLLNGSTLSLALFTIFTSCMVIICN